MTIPFRMKILPNLAMALSCVWHVNAEDTSNVADITEERLIGNYQKSATWQEKRECCLKLIDASIVRRGVPMVKLQRVFGGDLFVASGKLGAESVCFVYFEQQPDFSKSSGAVPTVGWYLTLEATPQGTVKSYSLSNLHK